MLFRDRTEAGQKLASELLPHAREPGVLVLALPRGGVPVAFEVARALDAPLDVFVVRKLGVPGQEELALGAIATGGTRVLNQEIVERLGISTAVIDRLAAAERRELERREHLYRGDRPPLKTTGRTVILVDDGIATGSSMLAAVAALRQQQPARIVVAIPVAPAPACEEIRAQVNNLVCLAQPQPFFAVGQWYEHFSQVSDEEVRHLLERAAHRETQPPPLEVVGNSEG